MFSRSTEISVLASTVVGIIGVGKSTLLPQPRQSQASRNDEAIPEHKVLKIRLTYSNVIMCNICTAQYSVPYITRRPYERLQRRREILVRATSGLDLICSIPKKVSDESAG